MRVPCHGTHAHVITFLPKILWRVTNNYDEQIINRSGPKQEPWGDPQLRSKHPESVPLIHTRWLLLNKYDLNQIKTFPRSPTFFCILLTRISWLTVSNATLRSNNTRRVTHCEFMECMMSFITFNKGKHNMVTAELDRCGAEPCVYEFVWIWPFPLTYWRLCNEDY